MVDIFNLNNVVRTLMKIIYDQIWNLYVKRTAWSRSLFPCNINTSTYFHVSLCNQTDLTTNTLITNENSILNHFVSNWPYSHFSRKINYYMNIYRSCILLSHGSTTNNIEIVNGNKQNCKNEQAVWDQKRVLPIFLTTQKKSLWVRDIL